MKKTEASPDFPALSEILFASMGDARRQFILK